MHFDIRLHLVASWRSLWCACDVKILRSAFSATEYGFLVRCIYVSNSLFDSFVA